MSQSIVVTRTIESENPFNCEKNKTESLTVESELSGALLKRDREEYEESKSSKKAKVKSKEEGDENVTSVKLGPKEFSSGEDMFNYFYNFLHYWPPNIEINKYEHMILLELIKRGHAEPEKIIGPGIKSFHIRYHPMWKSRCFFFTRINGISDEFSFRKCVDMILPLPDNMKIHSSKDKNADNCIKSFDVSKFANYPKSRGGGIWNAGRGRGGGFRK